MAGELSPDRLFFWDGRNWVSVLSPDGAWRWDGTAWRPARQPRRRWPLPGLIAVVTMVSVVLVGVGVYYAGSAFMNVSRRVFQSGMTLCTSQLAQPGSALAPGATLCGGRLGNEYMLADCTLSANGAPQGTAVWQKSYVNNKESDWSKTSVSSTTQGCNLSAAPEIFLSFQVSSKQPAQVVVVADFIWEASQNDLGIRLACTETESCVDIDMYSEGLYSLDEGRPNDGWDHLSKGVSFGSSFRQGSPNRMILRLSGQHVSAFLNGSTVTQANTHRVQSPGFVDFYLDNRQAAGATETVWLQRMYVFESL